MGCAGRLRSRLAGLAVARAATVSSPACKVVWKIYQIPVIDSVVQYDMIPNMIQYHYSYIITPRCSDPVSGIGRVVSVNCPACGQQRAPSNGWRGSPTAGGFFLLGLNNCYCYVSTSCCRISLQLWHRYRSDYTSDYHINGVSSHTERTYTIRASQPTSVSFVFINTP